MSQSSTTHQLLAAALEGAADVARTRLARGVTVQPGDATDSPAILRFDLTFPVGGRLTWYVTNEDATGFSDLLIGGSGDRGAVLTEMHLDALTVAFSDMLERAVQEIAARVSEPLEAGDLDLGMETGLPSDDDGGTRLTRALDIDGFGALPLVQHADADLAMWLEHHARPELLAAPAEPEPPAAPAPAPAAEPAPQAAAGGVAGDVASEDFIAAAFAQQEALLDAVPMPAGPPAPAATQAAASDNVVSLPSGAGAKPGAARSPRDLELLMNVPLPITVELGQTQRTIRELVEFSIGSVIELGKLAGDPLDIKVNDRVIARGEVVVIDEEFGIRVTEIVSPEDRLRGLA